MGKVKSVQDRSPSAWHPDWQHMRLRLGFVAVTLCSLLASPLSAPGQGASHTFGNPNVWRWAPSRTYHVENYKLTLHFDQSNGEVFGDEVVTLRPFEAGFRKFYLDSAELKIDSVSLQQLQGQAIPLTYAAEDPRLLITLDRDYDATSSLRVRIVYHGFPRTGLFFVNPTPDYPDRPQEVYTQGEAEFNHYWFPCWDYPNDMATSETVTTVPEGQTVVSNGKLVNVTHSAGQVTYDWVESVPHSSYLISIAAGPWRKVTDTYHDKPVDYYVPTSVDEATARRSFHLTPDMLEFFSRATGVEYPYEKYAQTTVRDYMFGGQENVSATTLTEWTLHDERADKDYPSTNLVSHELGQHWFGDYVQGRDWANIWLNEGFATYLETLYLQHHEGTDAYRFEIYSDQLAEQAQDRNDYRRPIVSRHYTDPMQMFDAITHAKGAAILDMLRYILDGAEAASHPASQDEPLFRAMHNYLLTNHTQVADTADLISAIRATTGQELDWFFREWVFMSGHPDYRVEASYNATTKIEKLVVTQTQLVDTLTPLFDMPIELAFYGANAEGKTIQVRDDKQRQEFDIPLDFEPLWVDFDPDDFIDKTVQFDQPLNALIAQAEKDPSMMSRLWAVQQLGASTNDSPAIRVEALSHVLSSDTFYAVRAEAAAGLGKIGSDEAKAALLAALQQPDSRVRAAVVTALGSYQKNDAVYAALVNALNDADSYAVQAAAAQALGKSGDARVFEVLQTKANTKPEVHVMIATLNAIAATKDSRAAEFLLAEARPGVLERIRLNALGALAGLKNAGEPAHQQELVDVVRAALHDPYFPIQEAAEEIVGAFHLIQFKPEIQTEALGAPTDMQREPAQQVLDQLNHAQ
jgi:aminopeptidase N